MGRGGKAILFVLGEEGRKGEARGNPEKDGLGLTRVEPAEGRNQGGEAGEQKGGEQGGRSNRSGRNTR